MVARRLMWGGMLAGAVVLALLGQFILLARSAQWVIGVAVYLAALACLWFGLRQLEAQVPWLRPRSDEGDDLRPPLPWRAARAAPTVAPAPAVAPPVVSPPAPVPAEGERVEGEGYAEANTAPLAAPPAVVAVAPSATPPVVLPPAEAAATGAPAAELTGSVTPSEGAAAVEPATVAVEPTGSVTPSEGAAVVEPAAVAVESVPAPAEVEVTAPPAAWPLSRLPWSVSPATLLLSVAGSLLLTLLILFLVRTTHPIVPTNPPQGLWGLVSGLRSGIRQALPLFVWFVPGLALILSGVWLLWGRQRALAPAAVLMSLASVITAEVFALLQQRGLAALVFLAACVLLLIGLRFAPDEVSEAIEPKAWSRRRELLWLFAVLAVAVVTRFYLIGYAAPNGIEGDESSWAYQVTQAMNSADVVRPYPFGPMPTTYWLQTLSFSLGGINIVALRIGVALLSLLATALFYFAAREMVNIPVALIATYLMSVSIIDLVGSRQAHVETYVKIFSVLAIFGVVLGYRWRQPLLFLVAGVSLALGLMVYDSFFTVPFGILVYVVYRAVRGWRQDGWRHLLYLAAIVAPIAPIFPQVWTYLSGRRFSQLAILRTQTPVYPDTFEKWLQILPYLPAYMASQAQASFDRLTVQSLNDVLLHRPGPIESAAFIPLFFLGLAFALWYWRRRQFALPLLWMLVPGLPTVLILGQTFPRTFLPYWGAAHLVTAAVLWVAVALWRRRLPRGLVWLPLGALLLYLGALGLSNSYVLFNELRDPADRLYRRELGELLDANLAPGQMLYWPFVTLRGDFLETEWRYPQFVARSKVPFGADKNYYRSIPYDTLLREVSANGPRLQGLKVFYDKTINPPDIREKVIRAFARCYPTAQVQSARYFDVYAVSAAGLAQPQCYSDADIRTTAPTANQTLAASEPLRFTWQASKGAQTDFRLVVQRHNDDVIWEEAEDFSANNGWEPQAHLAPDYLGRSYFSDIRQSGTITAERQVTVPQAGSYAVWARFYRRRDDGGPVRLKVGQQEVEIARPRPDALNRWVWEKVAAYDLPQGPLTLTLSRTFDKPDIWQIFIDTIVLSRDPSFDPSRQTDWAPRVDTGRVASPERSYTLAERLTPGLYRWQVETFDGDRLVTWDGTPGLTSTYSTFRIGP